MRLRCPACLKELPCPYDDPLDCALALVARLRRELNDRGLGWVVEAANKHTDSPT